MRIFGLKDEEIVKKRRKKKQKRRRGSWGRWGDGEVFVCDGEQEGPGTQNGRAEELGSVGEAWEDICEIGG